MDTTIALRCVRLSQDVYQDFSTVKFKELPGISPALINRAETDTQLAMLEDANVNVGYIVFRGSTAEKDWETNFDLGQAEYEWSREQKQAFKAEVVDTKITVVEDRQLMYPDAYAPTSKPVKMHAGFIKAYLSVRQRIHETVERSAMSQWIVTGHSLGGALATLCGLDIQYNFSAQVTVSVYTFGAPKVGNEAFVESYNRRVPDTSRFVYGNDIVTKLPRWWQGYRHVDREIKFSTGFNWRFFSGRVEDHRLTNYIARLSET
jgi:triacylglycerol lipase